MRRCIRARRSLRGAALLHTAGAANGRRLIHSAAARASPLAVREALAAVQQQLTRHRGEDARASARTDAKALVADVLRPRLAHSNDVVLHLDRQLTTEEETALAAAADRRSRGEPLAYVLGRKEFWSMEFAVSSDTLIPRADSEVLIETLVGLYPPQAPLSVLDVGTGSGCLLLAALAAFPNATGVGIDVSPGALQVARENARRHGLEARATFLLRDLAALAHSERQSRDLPLGQMTQRFDVVMSNPPYIPLREIALVAPEVLAYEPHVALFSDPEAVAQRLAGEPRDRDREGEEDDGLRMYRLLHRALLNLLKPESDERRSVLVEVGSEAQADAVRALFSSDPSAEAVAFERSELLLDGARRHRGVLLQTHA